MRYGADEIARHLNCFIAAKKTSSAVGNSDQIYQAVQRTENEMMIVCTPDEQYKAWIAMSA